jgi:hypothetical protein
MGRLELEWHFAGNMTVLADYTTCNHDVFAGYTTDRRDRRSHVGPAARRGRGQAAGENLRCGGLFEFCSGPEHCYQVTIAKVDCAIVDGRHGAFRRSRCAQCDAQAGNEHRAADGGRSASARSIAGPEGDP